MAKSYKRWSELAPVRARLRDGGYEGLLAHAIQTAGGIAKNERRAA